MTGVYRAALLLLVPTALSAQTISGRGGVSIATIGGADVPSADSRTGLNIGASVTFPITLMLGIQAGASYAQKGATETEQGVDVTFAVDYIEVPLFLRIGVPTAGVISPHFFVGPAISFEAKCEAKGTAAGLSVTVD